MSLTDLRIRRLALPEKGQKTYYDPALKGFGVRVSQGGTKTFVVLSGPARRRTTIGRYPEWSLADARATAKRIQADAALDNSHTAGQPPPLPFHEARERFLADRKERTRPKTHFEYKRLLERHFSWEKKLTELNRVEIGHVVDRLSKTPAEQKAAYVALRTMLNWCVRRGYLRTSPMPILTFKQITRDRVLSETELAAIWRFASNLDHHFGRIVQLLILTGQRRGEVSALRRSWLTADAITWPSEAVKNGREHTLPLTPLAKTLLGRVGGDTDLFFPARGIPDQPYDGFTRAKRAMDKTLDLDPYTLHDLRRTFSSNQAKLGTPIHITEKMLNHVSGTLSGVAAVYNRYSYVDEMRVALLKHEAFVQSLSAPTILP